VSAAIDDAATILVRQVLPTLREPFGLVFGMLQPLVFLVFFGPLLSGVVEVPGMGAFDAGDTWLWFVPAVLLMLALFGTTGTGYMMLTEMQTGSHERLMVTPMNRTAMLAGRVLNDVATLLAQSLRECQACGGDSVLFIPGRVGPDGTHDEVWKRSIPEVRRFLPLASRLGVRLLIENVWNGFCQKPELMRDYIDEIDNPWFGSYFDIGNACKFAPSEDWIRTLGRRIVKLDVKDWKKSKGLCDIGNGDVNWLAVREALAELGFSGWATAEVRGGGRDRLADIARRMSQVFQIN
jgi:hypothetical protein